MLKYILVAFGAAMTLAGCVGFSVPQNTFVAPSERYTGNTVALTGIKDAHAVSVHCATETITSPLSGEFFSYESDELETYIR